MDINKIINKYTLKFHTYFERVKKYVQENRFQVYLYVVLFSMLAYFISYSGKALLTIILFFILVLIDHKKYEKLTANYYNKKLDFFVGVIGICLCFFPYSISSLLNGDTVLSFTFWAAHSVVLLISITILFYGIKSILDFIMPIGFIFTFLVFSMSEDTYIIQELIGPYFVSFSVWASGGFLNILGYNVATLNDVFILPSGVPVRVLIWCSGIASVMLFSLLTTFFLIREKIPLFTKISLILIGAIGMLFVNVLRISILIIIAIEYGTSLMEVFHSHLGDILFIVYTFIFWLLALKYFVIKGENK